MDFIQRVNWDPTENIQSYFPLDNIFVQNILVHQHHQVDLVNSKSIKYPYIGLSYSSLRWRCRKLSRSHMYLEEEPLVLMKKDESHETMRICINDQNKKTIKNQYPIPRIDELIDELHGAAYFTMIALRSGYHQSFSVLMSWIATWCEAWL